MIVEAEKALMHYSFIDPIIEFIRHNENITFRVKNSSDDRSYLLRIHRPVSDGLSGLQHTRAGLESEMVFLREVDKKGTLKVQRPIVNQDGALVTEYISERFGPTYATLLEWMDGSTLAPDEENIDQIIYKLGEYLAELHIFSGP
ncbi:phosphotransferase enzyme family protein [Paenibacillus sp. NFR01]|uniref:phosphotransferase enzyme family protein n=1 Tax=Paenibacillus sp. NFR01 TaxID=1566279 RepID=UPI0008C6BF07|nr:phosphotransferase [Paenibacillus sp. NFR01]SEU26440.1 Phosphotransferase enzyme family protein [Paenibacillus sp. NFR01]